MTLPWLTLSRAVDKFAKFAGKAGKVLVVAAIAATVFSIAASESPLETVGWCAGEFAVGYIGSKLAVAAITGSATLVAALGPAGVCLLTLVALGGVAVGTYFLFEHLGGMFRKKPPEEWRPASEVISSPHEQSPNKCSLCRLCVCVCF